MGLGILLANHQAVKKAMTGHQGQARNQSFVRFFFGIARASNRDANNPG
jgi:hypothetical protein